MVWVRRFVAAAQVGCHCWWAGFTIWVRVIGCVGLLFLGLLPHIASARAAAKRALAYAYEGSKKYVSDCVCHEGSI